MATIGQQLLQPEAGWKRYDDIDSRINYTNFTVSAYAGNYNGAYRLASTAGATIKFKFHGTKLRVVSPTGFSGFSPNISISVDGVVDMFSEVTASELFQTLVYEKLNMDPGVHEVIITTNDTKYVGFDAIDIDSTGNLIHLYLPEKTTIASMTIGDIISCEYVATSGTIGSFNNLGNATKAGIPLASSSTPDGSFYFIMTGYDYLGRKKLVADRNIQHSISWDTLNANGLITENQLLISGDNLAAGKTLFGDAHANYPLSNAIDNNISTQWLMNHAQGTQESTTTRQRSITIDLVIPTQIKEFVIQSGYGLTSFDVEVSDDNINFTKIHSDSMAINSNKRFKLPKYTAARYFSISNIKSTYAGASLGLSELQLFSGEYYSIGIPTGGTSATDKDNDWDKIIVESTLNNTITAGDNNIWNWNGTIGSWTTSTGSTNSTRVRRGYNTGVGTFTNNIASSSATANTGFRPMLLVPDNIVIKSLIKDSLGRYIGLDGSVLYNAGTTPSDEIFQTYGVIDLNLINWTDLYSNFMPPFEIVSYIQEVYTPSLTQIVNEKEYNVVGRVYEKEIEVNDLERIKNIQVG